MKKHLPKHAIGRLFIEISKSRRNKTNALLSDVGIHAGQDILLYYLHLEDGQLVSSLVDKLCIQHGTISNMIDRMVANELISKEKDTKDKRASRIYLTEKGKRAYKQIMKVWNTMEALTTQGFTEKETAELSRLLEKVYNNLV
ncbi:MarR family winged helix-turn-helix transcriptional regulator [Chitinophaga vietnamensis]|uniref:MarR family winged helix-turn-helix transcriptional regulator n=1 Tax=Chitinophaga vietnamensis TaxID=2593957 RepID=UPI001178B978|nr:MarR family winged helix-turn-helix transcriptional regulator [Chitinophaga vietnamensis]